MTEKRSTGFHVWFEMRKIPRRVEPRVRGWMHHNSYFAMVTTEYVAAGGVVSVDPGLSRKRTTSRSAVVVGKDTEPSHNRPSLERYRE